jgi:rare lipoprotein A (peptidoglycan hydrolase)
VTSSSVGVRAAGLAGVALVAVAIALAIATRTHHHSSLPTPAGTWYTALAAPYTRTTSNRRSRCGVVIRPKTVGVAHPTLPCGAKIYVEFGSRQVLTQVIDRGPHVPGREFDLTVQLAKILHLDGVQMIRWRFAQ